MKLVHIGTADNSGGAARAAFRIHSGIRSMGCDSRILCGYSVESNDPNIDCIPNRRSFAARAFRFAVNKAEQLTGLEYVLLPWKNAFLRHRFYKEADVVHLHNLHGGFFPLSILPRMAESKVVVWSIHDQWPMTGHCYFPDMYDCSRWTTGCGSCPGLDQDNHYPISIDTTRYLWRRKRDLYKDSGMTLVAQSNWTAQQIRKSPLFDSKEVRLIPYGLNTELFRPVALQSARDQLNLPHDKKIVFFSAVGLASKRKGWEYLRQALQRADESLKGSMLLLTAGHLGPGESLDLSIPTVNLGYITNDESMALAYSAADLFAGTSLVETFGQVFSESMACGLPSVAFSTSGVSDVVRHMQTGYLARLRDVEDFAHGITLLLTDNELRSRMRVESRRIAEEEYSLTLQAQRYLSLYEELLERTRR